MLKEAVDKGIMISIHIKNKLESGELQEVRTVAFFATVQNEGDRNIKRDPAYYNLDMIIHFLMAVSNMTKKIQIIVFDLIQ